MERGSSRGAPGGLSPSPVTRVREDASVEVNTPTRGQEEGVGETLRSREGWEGPGNEVTPP